MKAASVASANPSTESMKNSSSSFMATLSPVLGGEKKIAMVTAFLLSYCQCCLSVLFTDVLLIKCEFYVRDLSRKLPAISYYLKITYLEKLKLIFKVLPLRPEAVSLPLFKTNCNVSCQDYIIFHLTFLILSLV